MHATISKSYIIPAIFLNPVLFLLSINTILSRLLSPVTVDTVAQPLPYSSFGPSAEHPHLDIHASEGLCWGYTCIMVCAQLIIYGKVRDCRSQAHQRSMAKRELACRQRGSVESPQPCNSQDHLQQKEAASAPVAMKREGSCSYSESDLESLHAGSDYSYATTDSENLN